MHYFRCNIPRHRRALRQRGAALVVAMLVFALATALVVAMKSEFTRFYQRSANTLLEEQAQAYLRGAEDLAGMVLLLDYDNDKANGQARDDLKEVWNPEEPKSYPLDDIGWMSGKLEDLQGRFNLNLLAERVAPNPASPATSRFTAAQKQFIRLLQAVGEQPISEQEAIMITESVSDWLDADPTPSQDGAEDEYYSAQAPAYRAGNRKMSSVSELRAVAHMTPQIYQDLVPWVTVLPEGTKLNIHTAPAMVLRTINADDDLSPLSVQEGEALEAYRLDKGFADKNDFLDNPVFAQKKDRMAGIMQQLDQYTNYFLLEATVEVAGRNMRLYSVLERSNNRSISALARANGSL
jgi:general secretion pathway protein K